MGWSEKYWEDVRSELEQSATASEPTSEDETLDQPAPGKPAPRLSATDLPAPGRPQDMSQGD